MTDKLVFVYIKDDKIRCLDLDQAEATEKSLIVEGWKHIATIDPCTFIEHLYNYRLLKLEW